MYENNEHLYAFNLDMFTIFWNHHLLTLIVLASRTAYRLTTNQPYLASHLHKEDKMTVFCMHMYNHSFIYKL